VHLNIPAESLEVQAWAKDTAARAVAIADELVDAHAWSATQSEIIRHALAEFPPPHEPPTLSFRVFLALLAAAGLDGGELPPIELGALTYLLDIALVLLDHVVDDDLTISPALKRYWAPYRPEEVNWAASATLALAPALALELPAPADRRIAVAGRLVRCVMSVADAQQRERRVQGEPVALAELVDIIGDRTGERSAAYAAVGAYYAGVSEDRAAACEVFGRALGTGMQMCNDVHDLFLDSPSKDVATGTVTVPMALELERCEGREWRSLWALFEEAQRDLGAEQTLRERLVAAGTLRRCAVLVGVQRARALAALDVAGIAGPARTVLSAMVEAWLEFGAA
jgi:geranylgeranyl pyrophosphate synthase